MTANDVREKYLKFFEKKGHKIIAPAPLIPENDSTTLFTSSGMQPLVPYLMGEPHPEGTRLTDSQPSLRIQDIEEVGDNRHTTFFEMLGNWSLGDYFKTEQLEWIFTFLTNKEEGLGLDPKRLYVTVFEGDSEVEKDYTSIGIWKEIFNSVGLTAEEGKRIFAYAAKKNWWSRSGTPPEMPAGEIGGPDSEIFYDFGEDLKLHENSPWKGEPCHPNCDCGRFLEIGNSVFIQYKKNTDGTLSELHQKNVDFGGGLERLTAASINNRDIFETDLFKPIVEKIQDITGKSYSDPENKVAMQVIADHLKAAVFLVKSGVLPSNKQQGYVLRRLIRRAAVKTRKIIGNLNDPLVLNAVIAVIVEIYKGIYFEGNETTNIQKIVAEEISKFALTIEKGLKELEKVDLVTGKVAFDVYQTYGFPPEVAAEILSEKGLSFNKEDFQKEFTKHQEISRTASAGMFKGGLADQSEETTKLHTVTHLLHASLRHVLGNHVQQKGSNITSERLRFDFTHQEKMSADEIKKVEDMVNAEIAKKLPVSYEVKTLAEALKEGALAFFGEKYGDMVKVYTIGDPKGDWFSKEVCGGPHVTNLEVIGHVTIKKEESVGSGVRRIYAQIAP